MDLLEVVLFLLLCSVTLGTDVARRMRSAAIRAERQELIRIWREN